MVRRIYREKAPRARKGKITPEDYREAFLRTFPETYAGNTEAADLLAFVEAEHSAERYKFWLESDFAKIWIAETIPGHSAIGYSRARVSGG